MSCLKGYNYCFNFTHEQGQLSGADLLVDYDFSTNLRPSQTLTMLSIAPNQHNGN